ncbi:MAG: diacylglyceryl transferase, partial [Sediminibacterium sp.]|nr:diacylglyceryl transferase [Sediminibacterium sp.]
MYPNLYYAFKDIFGIELSGLKLINSFGFFVALSFILSAWILTIELRRKQQQGLFTFTEEKIMIGQPASLTELFINGLLGFIFGYKLVGAFTIPDALNDPQAFILSSKGNLLTGMIVALIFAAIKWWEKKKEQLEKPAERIVRIWPHDRVGDIVIYAALFGFLGAKIFHNLENWGDFVKD